jgi:methionyl-tRNA synthetase
MKQPRTCYQTTPIYYVNDVPHPGHAYTTIAADALARLRRLRGDRVFFLTGTDEHGQNIERIAREKGVAEQAYCDAIAERFKALWTRLLIRYDGFIRTTDKLHREGVLELWKRLRPAIGPDGKPVIYRGKYAGWYCPRCEGFKTEAELKEPGHLCPDHERACEWTEEENFFFRLSAYQEWLRDVIVSGEIRIDPPGRRNEVLATVRQGLQDFSVSRARVKWGIPVPEEPSHVFYVWIDALANYITALGFASRAEEYRTFWEGADERFHFIGKEIIRFHCLYWPAMLHAAGLPVPTRLFAHGWLTKEGRKLSKTTGNIIDTDVLIDRHGADAVRYFLLREGSFGQDWDFTDAAFLKRYNADLANDLGNLVSRALTMAQRFCGQVPARPADAGPDREAIECRLQADCGGILRTVMDRYEEVDYAGALAEIWSIISQLNQRIVAVAPWELAKDEARRTELHAFLYRLLEAIRLVGVLCAPVIPTAARRIHRMLGLGDRDPETADLAFGRLSPGGPLGPVEPLFPRLEKAASVSKPQEEDEHVSEAKPVPAPASTTDDGEAKIDISEFARLDLRAAVVKQAESVPGSKKLIKLQVDLGTELRQVVAGIAGAYTPEELVGKSIVVVANLKPAKLMGVLSNGMVLAATVDGRPVLCEFAQPVPAGSRIK